jgi:tetratricopeptide (TPR) repeat protein
MELPRLREEAIFNVARRIEAPEARRLYLQQSCGEDAALRDRVEALLRVHDEECNFLRSPIAGMPTPRDDASAEAPGTAIGRYTLLAPIGAGGMGAVFLAEQTEPVQREVALKIIRPGMDSAQVIARFEAERQALALMDHPNIAKVHDAGTTASGRPYFVMELVKGIPITRYCDEHHLTPRQRLELFVPVCQAVQHAHQKGIIHRDLKPSNILVALYDGTAVPKVIDFGVAKATGPKPAAHTLTTVDGTVVGTPAYMSPEQAGLNQLDVDTRSDVYALGVMLYELLTGTTPLSRKQLEGQGLLEVLRLIREEEPPRPSARLSTSSELPAIAASRGLEPRKLSGVLRGELDWILIKCLEKDRDRRYESASALAGDLQRYLADEPVLACPPSAVYRFCKFARRHRTGLTLVALLAVMLTAGAVGLAVSNARIWQAKTEADRQGELARKRAEEAERAAAITRAVYRYLVDDVLASPDPELPLGRKAMVLEVVNNAAATIDRAFPGQPLVEAGVRHTLGATYYQVGEYSKAEPQLARAVELSARHLGRGHRDTLASMRILVLVLQSRGKAQTALRLAEETLKGLQTTLGPEHADTLLAQHNLAVVLRDLGRWDEARRLHAQTLRVRERTLGPSHRHTLQSRADECLVLEAQGKWRQTRVMRQDIVARFRATLGPEHPDTLAAQQNLANLLRKLGRLAEAQRLHEQNLKTRTRILGPEHPGTLLSRASLGYVLALRGRLAEARKILTETALVEERVLGEDHPHTLNALNDLAVVCIMQRQPAEGERLLVKVVARRTAARGRDHPDTLAGMGNLGAALKEQGKSAEARKVFEEVYARSRKVRGAEHPYALMAAASLAGLLYEQGEPGPALKLCRATLESQRRLLGPAHPDTLRSLGNLALIRAAQGHLEEARQLHEQTLAGMRKALGPGHPDTLRALHQLGDLLLRQAGKDPDRLRQTREWLHETLHLCEHTLGAEHHDTLSMEARLARTLHRMGQLPEAIKRFARVVQGQSRNLGPGHRITRTARHHLGMALAEQGKYAQARQAHEENLKWSKQTLGLEHTNTLETIECLAEVINAQGVLLHRAGKSREAEEHYRQALAVIEPVAARFSADAEHGFTVAMVSHNLARCLALPADGAPDRVKEAVALAQRAVSLAQGRSDMWSTLALAHYRAGDMTAALTAVNRSLRLKETTNPWSEILLAMIHHRRGDREEARRWYDRVVAHLQRYPPTPQLQTFQREAARLLGFDMPKKTSP